MDPATVSQGRARSSRYPLGLRLPDPSPAASPGRARFQLLRALAPHRGTRARLPFVSAPALIRLPGGPGAGGLGALRFRGAAKAGGLWNGLK